MNELNVGPGYREGVFSAISAGFFFILIGAIFVITPNLLGRIIEFLRDFDIVRIPNMDIFVPAPTHPKDHSVVYSAVTLFSFVWGLFQVLILALRFIIRSPLGKKAETVSNLVFWLGTSFLTSAFLNETITRTTWFVFWTGVIMLIGMSLVIRAFILAIRMYTLD